MPACDSSGNGYNKYFQVITQRRTFTFDSLECAVHKLAPT